MPHAIEPWAVCLPGRERRLKEPALTSMHEIVREVCGLLGSVPPGPPWVLFGHSMGALVAWELARHLNPLLLVVSGARPPDDPIVDATLPDLDDEELTAEVRGRFGGFPPEVDAYPELLELTLATLRADLTALARYRIDGVEPLDLPIVALRGADDKECRTADLEGWGACTRGGFRSREFEGGHHYLFDRPREVIAALREDVRSVPRP
jgi:surfactin synthase thioesterase subunit